MEATITVANAQVLGVDLKLTVGSESQTINVEAAASTRQTENGNVATNVSQKQIAEIPNSGNNMTYVTKVTPGMGTGFGVSGSTTLHWEGGALNLGVQAFNVLNHPNFKVPASVRSRVKLWHCYRDGQSNGYLQWCRRRRFAAHFAGSDEASLLGATQPAFSICGNERSLKPASVTTNCFTNGTSGSSSVCYWQRFVDYPS
jgi:hypothetical protein